MTLLAGAGPAVLAFDAPLGSPIALGDHLARHRAGAPISATPAALVSRATGHAIRARLGMQPLEVGADRIARTAVAALGLLARVRARSGRSLPVAVAAAWEGEAVVSEVYPAALDGSPDALDASLCVLAAADWVRGHAVPPLRS